MLAIVGIKLDGTQLELYIFFKSKTVNKRAIK